MVWKLGDLSLKCIQENLESYADLGDNLPNVYKELLIERLSYHDLYNEKNLKHISRQLFTKTVRHVYFKWCDQITDTVLQSLANSGCELEVVVFKGLKNVTDVGLESLLKDQSSLKKLHIKKLPLITHKALVNVRASTLWSFQLTLPQNAGKSWWPSNALANFLSNNPSIQNLNITTENQNIPVIARGLGARLEKLKTSFQSSTNNEIDVLAQHCPNLKWLDLNGAKALGKDSLLKLFQECTQLEYLDLGFCHGIVHAPENQVMWTLPQSLNTLSISGLMLQDREILVECLTRLKRLTSIKLCGVTALCDDTLAQILEKIGSRLTSLDLTGGAMSSNLTDSGMKSVAKYCTKLEVLQLSLLQEVTGATLMPIFNDPERAALIKQLFLNTKKMRMSILDQVVSCCPNLEKFDAGGLSEVTDEMIIRLANHSPKLLWTSLRGCTKLSDVSIGHLAGCCSLTALSIGGNQRITDKSIFCLASSCPQLEEIYLNGCTGITPAAVQYLKDCCLGRLYVSHNIPNASRDQMMARNLDTGEFQRVDLA